MPDQKRELGPMPQMRAEFGPEAYPCAVCTDNFHTSHDLEEHMQRTHPEVVRETMILPNRGSH